MAGNDNGNGNGNGNEIVIVVISPNNDIHELIAEMGQIWGISVGRAANPVSAVVMIAGSEKKHLVLVDAGRDNVEGFHHARVLKQALPHVPVVGASAYPPMREFYTKIGCHFLLHGENWFKKLKAIIDREIG